MPSLTVLRSLWLPIKCVTCSTLNARLPRGFTLRRRVSNKLSFLPSLFRTTSNRYQTAISASTVIEFCASDMPTKNIVLFGQTGAGKSSLVNLMAGEEKAKTSLGTERCTLHWEAYPINFDGHAYNMFDTIGLEEQELKKMEYLDAIENAYKLIKKLEVEGGVDLLLFCVQAGRITTTIQANYRLFYEWLCEKKVPIVLVLTHLEREDNMDNWWGRNKSVFNKYGIKVKGHACITTVQGMKYEESRCSVRNLVSEHTYGHSGGPYRGGEEWYKRFIRMMSVLFLRENTSRKKDIATILTKRCGMLPGAAKELAARITSDSRGRSPVDRLSTDRE